MFIGGRRHPTTAKKIGMAKRMPDGGQCRGVGKLEVINILIIEKDVVENLKLPMGACQSLLAKNFWIG